ncbi:MAG: nucleotidyltransferase domain-containing protein [Pseudomonadota bacterium]
MTEQHAQIVKRLTDFHKKRPGTVAIALFGSLAKGTATAASDVDLEVITADACTWSLEKSVQDGIAVDLVLCPHAHFSHQIRAFPFLSYDYLSMRCLFDPDGLFAQAQAELSGYFAANPAVSAYWEDSLKKMAEKKRLGTHRMADIFEAYDQAERRFSEDGVIRRSFLRGA